MSKEDILEFQGTINEILPNQTFKVVLENEHILMCYTAGKLRQHKIRLYDLDKGRITYRL